MGLPKWARILSRKLQGSFFNLKGLEVKQFWHSRNLFSLKTFPFSDLRVNCFLSGKDLKDLSRCYWKNNLSVKNAFFPLLFIVDKVYCISRPSFILRKGLRHTIRSQSYQTFIFPVFRFLLLSLRVCNIWKNVVTMQWPSLVAKNRKILPERRKMVW